MRLRLVALCSVIAILIVYLGISLWQTVGIMEVPRRPVEGSPASMGLEYEDISFPSRVNGITLKGWFIPGGPFAVMIINGYHCHRVEPSLGTLELSKDLVERGYSILLFDPRGCGESEGEGVLLTDFERDIGGAVDYLKSRGYQDIGILGFSLGAAEALIFAAEDGAAAIVSDSCFANAVEGFIKAAATEKGLPELLVKFFTPGILLMARIFYGFEVVDPVDRVADVSCPILFIHGEIDDRVPVEHAHRLYQASNNPDDALWIVPNVSHCQAYLTDPTGYVDRVTDFFEEGIMSSEFSSFVISDYRKRV